MASRKRVTKPVEKLEKPVEQPEIIEEKQEEVVPAVEKPEKLVEKPKKVVEKPEKVNKKNEKGPKFKIGSIVFVSKDAEADLNGFKLFPQYKKYTYTVEAYDAISGVYTLRRLNLSLRLKEAFILAPSEKAHDPLNRRQF